MNAPGRSAVVTGSTSGIGLAIALRLADSGYQVALNYSADDQRAAQAVAACRELNPRAKLIKADVGSSDGAAELIEHAVATFGRLDVLVNNAARVIDKPALEMTEADWDGVLDVNLKGAFLCAQHAARQMLTQSRGGVILNIGASTGIRGRRNGVNTCASKAGLMIMTQCLALEFAPAIRVNTIVPGMVVTDETTRRFRLDDPAVRLQREQATPLHRLGAPADVADAVMLLLSPEASFITGQKLVVDGGQNMWLRGARGGCRDGLARDSMYEAPLGLSRNGSCIVGSLAAHESSDQAEEYGQPGLGDATVEQLRADVVRLARLSDTGEPLAAFLDMRRVRDRIYRLLDQRLWPCEQTVCTACSAASTSSWA